MRFVALVALLATLSVAAVVGILHQSLASGPAQGADALVERAHPRELAGLWTRWPEAHSDGDAVRFWFFHPSGIGLYRFGKIGLNTTNSFDWHVDDGVLVLRFRKTGEVARTSFTLERSGGKRPSLLLTADPREPSKVRYTFVPPPARAAWAPDLLDESIFMSPSGGEREGGGARPDDSSLARAVAGRLWIDMRSFATGGSEFSLYQLKDASIDGRGVGWHHVGDFDDWSTEALTFRHTLAVVDGSDELELWFTVREERARTRLAWRVGEEEKAQITLDEDPRSFWARRTYRDGGPSFGWLWLASRGTDKR